MPLALSSALVALFAIGSGEARRTPDSVWNTFRTCVPFHAQLVIVEPDGEGGSVVVVSEPPPHARADEMARMLGARTSEKERHAIGLDGWVEDAVFGVPI